LGPYELFQEGGELSGVQQIAAPEHKGDIAVMLGNSSSERIVRFSVPTDIAAASMTIYDLSGRAIRSVSLVGLTHGVDYYQPIDITGLHGLYIVRIASENFSIAAKLQ
jgi:hypothetical protein